MAWGFFEAESYRRGAVLSSILNIGAQGLGFVTNIAFAYYFGTQAKTDVYYYCLSVLFLLAAFLGSANASVLIPESMRLAEKEGGDAAMRFLNLFLYVSIGLAVLGTVWMSVDSAQFFVRISRFPVEKLREHASIVYWAIPMFGLQVVAQLLMEILVSHRYFTLPMLLGAGSRLGVLAGLLFLRPWLDIESLLVSSLATSAAQVAICVYLLKARLRWRFTLVGLRVERRVLADALFAFAGNLATTVSAYAPVYLMSALASGVLTAMAFAQRLTAIPAQILTSQVSAVAGIKFNETLFRGDDDAVNRVYRRTNDILVGLLVPLSAFLCIYAREVITVCFKRGSFDDASVASSALFFRYLILGIPFFAVNTIAARVLFAKQRIRNSFWYQVAVNVVLAALIYLAVRRFGPVGYPAAQLAVDGLNVLALAWFLRWIAPGLDYPHVIRSLGCAYAVQALVAAGLLVLRSATASLGSVGSLAIGSLAAGALFVATLPLHPAGRECLATARSWGRELEERASR